MLTNKKFVFIHMDNGEIILLNEESTNKVLALLDDTYDNGFNRKFIQVKNTDDKEFVILTNHISYIE